MTDLRSRALSVFGDLMVATVEEEKVCRRCGLDNKWYLSDGDLENGIGVGIAFGCNKLKCVEYFEVVSVEPTSPIKIINT